MVTLFDQIVGIIEPRPLKTVLSLAYHKNLDQLTGGVNWKVYTISKVL